MIEPYYSEDGITIYNARAEEVLPQLTQADLILTDPPYGRIGGSKRIGGSNMVEVNEYDLSWDVRLNREQLESVLAIGKRAIVWGGNYYSDILPVTNAWLVWDKKVQNGWDDNFSDGEMAWTNIETPLKIYRHLWMGCLRKNGKVREHPTEKPVELMQWCIQRAGTSGTIIDPYLGSGTTLLAAKRLGRRAVGIEMSEEYCRIAVRRLSQMQMVFDENGHGS